MNCAERGDRLCLFQEDEGKDQSKGPNHEAEEEKTSGCPDRPDHEEYIVKPVQ